MYKKVVFWNFVLTFLCIGLTEGQAPEPGPEPVPDPREVKVKKRECGQPFDTREEGQDCSQYIFDRVGCCPADAIDDCALEVTLQDGTNQAARECQGEHRFCEKDRDFPQREECHLKREHTNTKDVTLNDPKTWDHFPSRLGKPCNHELYTRRMRPIWDIYLQCPKNPKADQMLQEVITDMSYHMGLLDDLCFSRWMLMCNESNICECFAAEYSDLENNVFLSFRQVQEGRDHCGLMAGKPCTHYTRLKASQHTYEACKDPKYEFQVNDRVPAPFDCEIDAYCRIEEDSRQCPLGRTKPCVCECAVDHKCIGTGGRHLAGFLIISLLPIIITIT